MARMSAPPMKAPSPAPRSTTARTSRLVPARRMAAASASVPSPSMTLSFAALSWQTVATRPPRGLSWNST